MKKTWMYFLFLGAVAGMVLVMGSLSGDSTAAAISGPGGAGLDAGHNTYWMNPYYNWFVRPTASKFEYLIKVPPGKKFVVDDVIITTSLSSVGSYCLERGIPGNQPIMCVRIPGGETFTYQFSGLRLNENENLTVFSPTAASSWTVTGHLI